MGIFTSAKPKITEKEVKELGNELENVHGFTQPQRQFVVDVLLKPQIKNSPYETTPSISSEEATRIKESISDKTGGVYQSLKGKNLSDAEIGEIEGEIDKYLIVNH